MAETSTTALCGLADIPDGGSTVVENGGTLALPGGITPSYLPCPLTHFH